MSYIYALSTSVDIYAGRHWLPRGRDYTVWGLSAVGGHRSVQQDL